jgi:hypothetical protein
MSNVSIFIDGNVRLNHLYAKHHFEWIPGDLAIRFLAILGAHKAHVGEAAMRVERKILAFIIAVLAMFAVSGTAVADDDPGMTHNGTEMTHN